jgi:DNA-binding CsgD family transcriptional regulator
MLEGVAGSRVDPLLAGVRPMSPGGLWLICREALDADAPDIALRAAERLPLTTPNTKAVRAAIEAAATTDEARWHEALRAAADHGLRLIAVDALEGLAVAAASNDSFVECLRLAGAAARLREETGYRWRFPSEQARLEDAGATAQDTLGEQAEGSTAEGHGLDWRDAATYARRARGERKRPRHGWSSLTPTEHQVIALVAEGLTNPQIASQLIMGRATVKTHLEHVFTKLGVHSRAEVAGEVIRRTGAQ